jgi:putative transposase
MPTAADPPEVVAAWPAPSTRGAILSRAGLTQRRRRRRRVPATGQSFSACDRPNAVWCADFKGWFRTRDGQRCDPLTVSDAYSRMLLCCQALAKPDYEHAWPAFERTFREYGLPDVIRTDNGPPFASVAAGGLSRLAVWWVKLGIQPERIEPGHPEQNGRHERMHLTLKQECCCPPAGTPAAQQLCFDTFGRTFNYQRPHQALGLQPPAVFYKRSTRSYPAQLEDPVYPADAFIRRVRSNGVIKWKGNLVFLSEALIGEAVGIIETPTGFEVHFGPIRLGRLDVEGERIIRH